MNRKRVLSWMIEAKRDFEYDSPFDLAVDAAHELNIFLVDAFGFPTKDIPPELIRLAESLYR